jgi:hypothetical protein
VVETGRAEEVEAFSPVANRWIEARMSRAPEGVTPLLQDVTARRRRQDAATFLAEASRQLAASLDHEATMRAVAYAAVPMLGDWCVVTLVEDPESRPRSRAIGRSCSRIATSSSRCCSTCSRTR